MIYTITFLAVIIFFVSCMTVLQSNSFKYFNTEYKEFIKNRDVCDTKEKLFTCFYDYLKENRDNYENFNDLLENIDGYENILDVDNKGECYTKNIRLVLKNNVVYIDYAYKIHAYKHERYTVEEKNDKFLLKNVYNNTSNEENNYEEI